MTQEPPRICASSNESAAEPKVIVVNKNKNMLVSLKHFIY